MAKPKAGARPPAAGAKKGTIKGAMQRKPRTTDHAGLAAALKATKMTRERWSQLQVGMKEKWPQPDYMLEPHPEDKGYTSYRDETFELVTRFQEKTRIAYRPHAKAPGTKSHVRYEKYSTATTVGEALKKGSWPVDWCWDIERGYIKVKGGLRKEPLDISEVKNEAELTDVDRAVVQWYRKELAKKYDLNYKDLVVEKGGGESIIMRAHRLVAQREAKKILQRRKATKGAVSDEDLGKVLSLWGFARNSARVNVMKKGLEWVWSDTLGLLRDRMGDIHLTRASRPYSEVLEVMNLWLSDRLPSDVKGFTWTSLNVNKDYAARIHRDGNNFGPSMIAAFGDFKGGRLSYFPDDDGRGEIEKLEKDGGRVERFDLKEGLALFNGNCAHSVEDFTGNRFSIVFFTLGCHADMKPEDRKDLERMGFATPQPKADPFSLLRPPSKKCKLAAMASPARKCLPASRYWSRSSLKPKQK